MNMKHFNLKNKCEVRFLGPGALVVLTRPGFVVQVATWVDDTLSTVASKLEHSAQAFSELQGERIVSLHCCALYTCAQLESCLCWW